MQFLKETVIKDARVSTLGFLNCYNLRRPPQMQGVRVYRTLGSWNREKNTLHPPLHKFIGVFQEVSALQLVGVGASKTAGLPISHSLKQH
jgi:hypothetical protein